MDHVKKQAERWSNPWRGSWSAMQCDLSKREETNAVFSIIKDQFDGRLDVLINNAFPTTLSLSEERRMEADGEVMEQEWEIKLAIGITAPYILSRLCIPLLTVGNATPNSTGTIINMSSTRAYQSEADHEAYYTANAGLLGLTQSIIVSLGHRHKIRVNATIPGWIHALNKSKSGDEKQAKWEEGLSKEDIEWHPAGRVANADDIARAVEYLVGSEIVIGQEIVVDGGVGRIMVYPESSL